ncbi:hypothetical protein TNCV_116231 [Trichonephila clavipes]|nr:hypothetical protein TNCV_116231 [Trichonephila clavipes]
MTCCAVLFRNHSPGHHDCSIARNEKVSNHGSIPITIDCNVVAFIVLEEGFHQPIKRTKQLHMSRLGMKKWERNPVDLDPSGAGRTVFYPSVSRSVCFPSLFD